MRIFYLSRSIIPSRHANSVHIMRMCQAFATNGHDVTLFSVRGLTATPGQEDPFQYFGVQPVFQLIRLARRKVKLLGSLLYSLQMIRRLRRMPESADLMYSRDLSSMFLARNLGPYIVETHHLPDKHFQIFLFRRLAFHRNLIRLVVISEQLKADYLKAYPQLTADQIIVAHDGADPVPGLAAPRTLPAGSPLDIGYVGALYPGRGVDMVLALARRLPGHRFHIIGGYERDIQHWSTEASGLANVQFHGYVPNGQLGQYYERLDLVLAPYHKAVYTGNSALEIGRWISPMKVFEYMAYGKPMIVSNLPAIAEVLEDGRNSLLCEPGDVEVWAARIQQLADDPAERLALGQRALADLQENHTWAARAQRILGAAGLASLSSDDRTGGVT
jgi:glycosyltransferase involved in cell wall biosynthesis